VGKLITADGWFTFAVRDLGPLDRWYHWGARRTPCSVITHHSLEGYVSLVSRPSSGYNVMRDPSRFPTAYHWTVSRKAYYWNNQWYPEGTVFQHYPVDYQLQHGHSANILGPGGESEEFGDPSDNVRLTPAQEDSWLLIHEAMEEFKGRPYVRIAGSTVGLVEHREMTIPPGLTRCPSHLYDSLWVRKEQEMSQLTELQQEVAELRKIVVENGIVAVKTTDTQHLFAATTPIGESQLLTGKNASEYARIRGLSIYLSVTNLNNAVLKHTDNVNIHTINEGIPDHEHKLSIAHTGGVIRNG
jgi:hypothetical protein